MTSSSLSALRYALCASCSGVGKKIQIGIDFFERIGEKKNPDADQKETAHEVDDPHVSFDAIKSGEECVKGQGGEQERNA